VNVTNVNVTKYHKHSYDTSSSTLGWCVVSVFEFGISLSFLCLSIDTCSVLLYD